MLPIESNLDLEGFSEEDFLKKVTVEKEDERSQLFHIRSLEQSDTGTYSCLDDKNDTDFLYVFVEGLYEFLKPKTYTLDVTSSKFLLPCRNAQIGFEPVWPSLFVDGEEWLKDRKERDAVTFDSGYGFEIDLVKLNRSLPMGSGRFRCVASKGDEVEWFVRFASMPVDSVSMTIPDWFTFGNVTVQCDLRLDNTTSQFENQLQMQCPRCGEKYGPKIQKDVRIHGNSTLFSLSVIFEEVKSDDYGRYTCSWPQKVVNKWDAKTHQSSPFRIFSPLSRMHFAPHAEVLTVFQGEPIRIKATILPIAADFVNYTCTWRYTRYVDVGRQKVSSSYGPAMVACGERPYLKVDENGRVESYTEELFIPSHKLAPGGTYRMIEMSAGQNLSLRCQSTTANTLRWMMPIESNLDLEGFSEEDFQKRVTVENEDERSQLFHIRSLKQSDTGTYSCLDDKNHIDFRYVFVEGLYDFLKPKTYTLDVTTSKFLLPCRYAQIGYLPVWPSLFVDGEEWLKDRKERDAVTFDSRYGFEIDLVKLNRSLPMGSGRFRCVALNGDRVEWFVRFPSMPVNSVSITIPQLKAFVLALHKRKNFTVQCDLRLDNTTSEFENQLQVQCPRCREEDGPKIQKDVRIHGNSTLFSLSVIFEEVKLDDYGLYTCSWPQKVVNQWDAKTQQMSPFRIFSPLYRMHFAPHPEVLTVFQGEPIRIKATILPIAADFVNYTCTWSYTRYVDVGTQKVFSSYEKASVDCGNRPYLKVDEDGRVESYTEELFIPSHKLAAGGTYGIVLSVMETEDQWIRWKVNVDPPVKDFTFNVQSSAHFVQFDKVYHVIGAKIRLGCHSRLHVDEDKKLHLFYQRSNKMVSATSVTGAKNVYWNTAVHEDLIVVCRKGTLWSDPMGIFHQGSFHLRVAGQRPAVWMKRDPEISGEDPNRVYRGDDITLFCRVHMLADISMFWIYNKTVLDESNIVQSIDGDSVLLKMTIKNISTNNSGDYICVARNTETRQELNQTIGLEIHEMIAPVLLDNETEIVHIKAGESHLLDCKMSGDPTPSISWSKNGIAMKDSESLLVNASIVLPKVDTDDSGVYECVGKNRVGEVRRSISLEVKDDKRRRLILASVALSIIFLILLACVLNFVILWRRQKARARNQENAFRVLHDDLINGGTIPAQDRNKQIPLDQQINQIVYDRSKFEISCDDLQISDQKTLGTSIRQHIINIQMLADELKLMSLIPPHPNVLTLIGAVTDHLTSGRLCVVTELCAKGSLEKFLKNLTRDTFCNELRKAQNSEDMEPDRKNRGNTVELSIIRKISVDVATDSYIPWTQVESQDEKHDGHEKTPIVQTFLCSTSDLLSFAMQIASGMEFLSEIPCIHRDLAARNILITEKNICRIADFGLARSTNKSYYRKDFGKPKNDLLPLQWMSPESMESGYYTQASDVWSYGILLYELFTLGDRPYPGIPLEEIYPRTNERPLFKDCVQKMRQHLEMVLPGKAEEIEGNYRMIQMSAGQNLSLRCQSTTANRLQWMLPIESNLDLEGFSEEDFLKRVTVEKEDERSQLFHIRSLEQSDTGKYSCLDEKNHTDFVYVFVEGLYEFLKPKTYTLDVTSSKFLLPCRYAEIGHWRDWPSLFVDGEEWLIDSEALYAVTSDLRYGFEIDLVKLNRSLPGSGRFRCVASKGDEVEWFVRFASMPCMCPRCRQKDGPKIQKDVQIHGDSTLFSLSVIFEEVEPRHFGLYTCSWPQKVVNKWDAKTQQTSPFRIFFALSRMHFAPHAEELTVFQGEPIRIKATILPIASDFVKYTCKWSYMRYVDVGRQKVSSREEMVDCGKRPYLKVDENGRVESYTEELFIPSHKLAPGETYEITFNVFEQRYQMIQWKVKVDTPVKDFTFNVQSSDHFVQFDKVYHVIGAKIRLGCHSRRHVDKLHLFYQRSNKMVPAASVTGANKVFWNTTVHEDLIVVCSKLLSLWFTSRTSLQGSFHLRVAGQRPAVWIKRDPEIRGEDPNRTYRGDDITLFCRIHMVADISMFWIHNQTVLDESSIGQSIDGDSVLLKMTLKNISTNNSGDYICVARNTETEQEFNQTIGLEIHEMIAPVLLVNETEIVHIKAGESQLLDCKMSGDPTPFISWSKNGIAMRDSESLLVNASIVLPKVDTDDSGVYECVGKNRVGEVRRSISLQVKDDKRRRLMVAFVAFSIIFIISLACVLNFVILWRRQKARARNQENAFRVLHDDLINGGTIPAQDRNKQIPLDQQINQIVYDRSKLEISCDDLQISDRKTLGSGQFGKVSMGFLKKPNQINNSTSERPTLKVAVKEPFHAASIRQHIINIQMLADELKLMSLIPPHPNVLTLIGAVTDHLTSGRLCVVTELCANGSLEKFLKNLTRDTFCNELRKAQNSEYMKPDRKDIGNTVELSIIKKKSDSYIPWTQVESQDEKHDGDEKTPIVQTFLCSTSDLLSFAMQIASGMEFLSEIPCIHRDLAARNILITEKNICRIADFGLARSANNSYYRKDFEKHKKDLLPLQWMSPESIESGYYTQASDVWAYGILLYELFTLGNRPYPGIPLKEIYLRVRNGERNKKPEFVHDDLYNFMLKCWNSKTQERPLFKDCVQKMREHLEMVLPGKAEEIEGKLASEVDRLNSYSEWRNGNTENTNSSTLCADERELSPTH
ncbi:unnamed protein product, partial [Mesorhabditis belari]|uniref:Receptor protein-tyrosine kinase n=1 Tax=Mesorhabditis belari TaxID=2138241 RepID=A0AAF3F7G0_9BILA